MFFCQTELARAVGNRVQIGESMMKKNHPNYRVSRFWKGIGCAIIVLFAQQAAAQNLVQHPTSISCEMPPGLAAETCRVANPAALTFHVQPVRIVLPEGAQLHFGRQGSYVETLASRVTLGMLIGPVYRLKVTQIPRNFGRELYPSIEILDKLNPPPGLESKFPIQVVITQDDLEQALEGRMVTKVIYLEDPETALPQRHRKGTQPYFDVGGGEDPLRAAKRLGRPMAILRIGSRVPTHTEDDLGFGFNGLAPIMIAHPESFETPNDSSDVEGIAPSVPGSKLQNRQDQPVPYPPPIVPDEIPPMKPGNGGR